MKMSFKKFVDNNLDTDVMVNGFNDLVTSILKCENDIIA